MPGPIYFLPGQKPPCSASRISAVFEGRLAAGTALLGGALCMSLLLAYLLVNWIPLLFRQIGLPLGRRGTRYGAAEFERHRRQLRASRIASTWVVMR